MNSCIRDNMYVPMFEYKTYLCLCSMLMMNRASLASTVADCWTPFLVEQNYRITQLLNLKVI